MLKIAVTVALVLSIINLGLLGWQLRPEPESYVRRTFEPYRLYDRLQDDIGSRLAALEAWQNWDGLRR